MNIRKIVQVASAGIVLGGEAVGAVILHESGDKLEWAAPVIIVAITFTVWVIDFALDFSVRRFNLAASLLGVRPSSGIKIHGYWFSAIRDRGGNLLGGSVFLVQAGIENVELSGLYKDLTVNTDQWTWWSGEGAPFGYDAILYSYWGVEDGNDDEGYGKYSFPRGGLQHQILRGSFYGKNLPDAERDRTAHGERVPKAAVTREFRKDPAIRREALEYYLNRQPRSSKKPSRSPGPSGWLDRLTARCAGLSLR
jgi:hypothetical protein